MKNIEVRKTKYGYALDMNYLEQTTTIYFNSFENANAVKIIMENDRNIKEKPLTAIEAIKRVVDAYNLKGE